MYQTEQQHSNNCLWLHLLFNGIIMITYIFLLQPCLPPYYNHVSENIGMRVFFQNKMSAAVGIALGVAGGLVSVYRVVTPVNIVHLCW